MLRILLIDDSEEFRKLLVRLIHKRWPDAVVEEYDPIENGYPERSFPWGSFDVLLLDYILGDDNGLKWLEALPRSSDFPAIIFLTAYGNEMTAVQAMKLGVDDYLRKQDLNAELLNNAIDKASRLHQQVDSHAYHQRVFFEHLNEHLSRPSAPAAVIMFRVDQDTRIKDSQGQTALRSVIVSIHDRITLNCPSITCKEYYATFIGDSSIALLISDCKNRNIEQITSDILAGIEALNIQVKGEAQHVTMSAGILMLDALEKSNTTQVLEICDVACRTARIKGGNHYHFYNNTEKSGAHSSPAPEKKTTEKSASQKPLNCSLAIEEGHFHLFYQTAAKVPDAAFTPIPHLIHVQMNMVDAQQGILPPSAYLPLAVKEGKIIEVGRHLINSCKKVIDKLSPNLSKVIVFQLDIPPNLVSDRGFWAWLLIALGPIKSGYGRSFVFGIDQSQLIQQESLIQQILPKLREENGCHFMLNIDGKVMDKPSFMNSGIFRYVKLSLDRAHAETDLGSIARTRHKHGQSVVVKDIESANDLANAILNSSDYVYGHYIQAPGRSVRRSDFGEEVAVGDIRSSNVWQ